MVIVRPQATLELNYGRGMVIVRPQVTLELNYGRGPQGDVGTGLDESFETYSKNLEDSNATPAYTGSRLDSITYANGVVKTLNYTGELLTSIVLSGPIPFGIPTTKTLSYDGSGNWTGTVYS